MKQDIQVSLPPLFRIRMALAAMLVGFAASIMASALNRVRVEVE